MDEKPEDEDFAAFYEQAGGAVVNVDDAGFAVHTDAKSGTVTITLRQSVDQNALKQILTKAGIRTYFSSTILPAQPDRAVPLVPLVPCKWVGATLVDSPGIDSVVYPTPSSPDTTITIDPSKMPSGSVLAFAFEYLGNDHDAVGGVEGLLSGEPTGCVATSDSSGSAG